MPDFSSLNWIAIVVSTLVFFGVSWAWHGPVFGAKWAEGMGYADPDMKPEAKHFVVTLAGYFVLLTALAGALHSVRVSTIGGALLITVWLWLGFIASITLVGAIWDSRPLSVWGINASLGLVGMIVAAIILTMWPA